MIQVIKATNNPVASIVEHSCGVVVFEMPYLGVTRGYGEFMDLYKADPDALWVVYQPHDVVLNYDELANEWDADLLEHWGLKVPIDEDKEKLERDTCPTCGKEV